MPEIRWQPGMADDLMRQMKPFLAEEGVDLDGDDPLDLATLQRALNHAMERYNMSLFTPVGAARELAAQVLRLVAEAIANGDRPPAESLLERIKPESPDGLDPTVSGCIGIAVGRLDEWLSGQAGETVPIGLASTVRLPAGRWPAERVAQDLLALAAKGRAFRSLDTLMARRGGKEVLWGSALAVAAVLSTWSQLSARRWPSSRAPSFAELQSLQIGGSGSARRASGGEVAQSMDISWAASRCEGPCKRSVARSQELVGPGGGEVFAPLVTRRRRYEGVTDGNERKAYTFEGAFGSSVHVIRGQDDHGPAEIAKELGLADV